MKQLSFIDHPIPKPITNVAKIPQRSLSRYPGGKTWLVPRIREWLNSLTRTPDEFIEPFAGGAIVALTVAFERLAKQVTIVELDHQVAAVWHTIINGDGKLLAERIANFNFTPETVDETLKKPAGTLSDLAFQTILKNRVNRGGILANGAGRIKNGENGKGLRSRWYPQTLKQRILDIVSIRDRIRFIEGDGLSLIRAHADRGDTAFFIDPPYTAGQKRAGSRLYTHSDLDHAELFRLVSKISGDFLITYDNANELYDFARQYHFDTHLVAMKNTHHAKMTELLMGKTLDWAR
ncbi:MAG: DNA adenine methylase [Chloroflexi bacterium AL-W]|nr:DNA adenine methylase [Chloroflexi bacterium AL-N1]NOK65696.1 DNA adenine methylase [Chloroflexi bacterium AL-N10]NOK74363.1 DNA adenine methylase [Chloroflexi bacterium AL-N5]NOK80729.1 DNA adenine methylase [Chloroflexi bacterium AL-W]NOK88621.1 DNA adenine methylase [Chloroflexi bacterium AL-N15]